MKKLLLLAVAAITLMAGNCNSDPVFVAVRGVNIAPIGYVSVAVGSTITLTATVVPPNATNKDIVWSSSDISRATVNASGVVTGVSTGTIAIRATPIEAVGAVGPMIYTEKIVVVTAP